MKDFEMEIEVEGIMLIVSGTYYPYRPAVISGPPEMCYEAEGDLGDVFVFIGEQDITDLLSDEWYNSVCDEVWSRLC